MAKQIEKNMKKIVICTAVLAMMTVVSSSASQTFDDPPQKQWGQTRFDENCRDQGVTYNRTESDFSVEPTENVDVNMTIERKNGTSQSYDTRNGWQETVYNDGSARSASHHRNVSPTDNVDIRCYPKKQEK